MVEKIGDDDELYYEVGELGRLKRNITSLRKNSEDKIDEVEESRYKKMIDNQGKPIMYGNREKPEISITFDDGYGPENIKDILDTLRGSNIHATFFILGDCLRKTPELWKQAVDEGHQICCHTFSHIYLSNNSDTTDLKLGSNRNININKWENDVKTILGDDYYEKIKSESGIGFPQKIKSDILLKTEILMREETVKKTLGEDYLNNFKQNYPFFRFPGGNGSMRSGNIAVLKELGYLSIYWSDDRPASSSNKLISNGSIPLFHFNTKDRNNIKTYIKNMKNQNKTSLLLSDIINP